MVRASCWLHAAAALGAAAHPPAWPWALGGVLANHAALAAAGVLPRSGLLGPNLRRLPEGPRRRDEVALTFDDGPDPDVTPRVLDLLEEHGATVSFFLIGRRAARHAPLVREIARRGHSAENHTHRHPAGFAALPFGAMRREIDAAQDAIADASVRAVFSTNLSSIDFRGFTLAPEVAFERVGLFHPAARTRVGVGPVFASGLLSDYFCRVEDRYVRPGRPAYDASGGYLGTRLTFSHRRPLTERISVGGGRVENFTGTANADSPLYRREWNLTLFAGVSVALYRSERTVDSASEPFD